MHVCSDSVELDSLYVLSDNLSVSLISQLPINSFTVISWLPVDNSLFKEGMIESLILLILCITSDKNKLFIIFHTCVTLE